MKVHAVVDSMIHLQPGLPKKFIAQIKSEFTHANPDFHKKQAMGYATWGIERTLKTFKVIETEQGERIAIPRGGSAALRKTCADFGFDLKWLDMRTQAPATFPKFCIDPNDASKKLYPYQESAVATAIRKEQGIIRAPTGCLAPDTIVGLHRAGKSYELSIEELYQREKNPRGNRKPGVVTHIRSVDDEGYIRLFELTDVFQSGVKKVFRVVLEDGESIEATKDHRFKTLSGWKRLSKFVEGEYVAVDRGRVPTEQRSKKKYYRLVNGLKHHPHAGRKGVRSDKGGYSVPFHRLVVEANLSGYDVEDFISIVRSGEWEQLTFIDPKIYAVHHKDHDHRNNDLENLEVLTHKEHERKHGFQNWRNVTPKVQYKQVESIEYSREVMTYDIEVQDTGNFIANGFMVHNSGKTYAALALIERIGQRAIVVMRDSNLMDQWIDDAKQTLGLGENDIGIIRGAKKYKPGRPLTFAMQQSLYSRKSRIDEILKNDPFGTLIIDECQGVAAKTFIDAVHRFPCRYRIGFSADESRRDKKEFLIYDQFGKPIFEIEKEKIEKMGVTVPVTVRVLPTDFSADWYRDAEPVERDFNQLLAEMTTDDDRNDVILKAIRKCVEHNEVPVVIFTHRREHARMIADDFLQGYACGLLLGGSGSDKVRFQEDRQRLKNGELKIAVATFNALGVGHNFPDLRAGICVTPISKKNRQYFGQVRGRICRSSKGKREAFLYYVADQNVFPHIDSTLRSWNDDQVEHWNGNKWV